MGFHSVELPFSRPLWGQLSNDFTRSYPSGHTVARPRNKSSRRAPHSPRKRPGRPRSLRQIRWAALLLGVLVVAFFARTSYSLWAKQVAANRLQVGAISEACRYLRRAARSTPEDGTIDMMLAFCFRQLHETKNWQRALQSAKEKSVSRALIERETQLYRIQTGDWQEEPESQLAAFAGQGVTDYDVPAAFVSGCLADGRNGLARQIFDAWSVDCPDDAHVAYMRGKYWESLGDTQQARAQYEAAIALESRHELAHLALAEMFEQNDQLNQAFELYAALASVSPASEIAALGASRILRKMGHLSQAQAVLDPFVQTTERPMAVAEEMGRIAMDRGDLPVAERWFERAGIGQTRDPLFLITGVSLLGMQGKALEADHLYQRLAALGDRVTRIRELRTRLALDPGDVVATEEIKQLTLELNAEMTSLETLPAESAEGEESSPGRRLFALHCAACHGPEGDATGRAARHLWPPPRNLRWEPSRLVSTNNGVPTLDDTILVLRRGIPGTSMPSYSDLGDEELRLLAEEVHRLRREGLPEQFMRTLAIQGEEITEDDMEEVNNAVAILTTPGDPFEVPSFGPTTPESLARGEESYLELGCASCHGEDGVGADNEMLHDERGFSVRPRDLTCEPFKGGRDLASVYFRIAAGMPGTPHPSCTEVATQDLAEVVQFCLSLSHGPEKVLTDHQRAALANSRAYLASLDAESTGMNSNTAKMPR